MKVLITGAFGFLGGRLAQRLHVQDGCDVVLATRADGRRAEWLPGASVRTLRWDSTVDLASACCDVDAVVHLAAMNAQQCAADGIGALQVNAIGTGRLLEAAVQSGVGAFIYLSTAHVYRAPLNGVIIESDCPMGLHPYATSHRAAEDLVLAASRENRIRGLVVRLSNAYGAPAHADADCWTLLVNDLCRQAATGGPLLLRSSGVDRRDFVPIGDVCGAISHLLAWHGELPERPIFNLGGQWAPTVLEMASLIQARSEIVIGRRPEMIRPADRVTAAGQSGVLEYRIDALLRTGYVPTTGKTDEIDQLLGFCQAAFQG